MKKILIALLLIATACAPIPYMASATLQPTTCKVYSIKSWYEIGITLDGSFSQLPASDGGVTSGLLLKTPEINFIKSLNGPGTGSWSWGWAADKPKGLYYQSIDGVSIDQAVYWNWVAAPSPDQRITNYNGVRNVMCVSKIVRMYGEDYAFVVGAPKGIDYSKYQQDWLVQPVYGDWEWQTKSGTWAGMPHIYNAYMFDPASGFAMKTASDKQFRFPAAWLYKYISTDSIPWLVAPTSTPFIDITVTASATPTATFTPTLTPTATIAPPSVTPSAGTVVYITANPYLSVRPDASMSNVPKGNFYIGTKLTLTEIMHIGADVWGREGNGYWIALLLNGKYYTTWRLN